MLYKAIQPDDGAMAIFAAVHLLRWEREWGEPKLLFVEAEPADLLKDERVKALVNALAPFAMYWDMPDACELRDEDYEHAFAALAPFMEATDGTSG